MAYAAGFGITMIAQKVQSAEKANYIYKEAAAPLSGRLKIFN